MVDPKLLAVWHVHFTFWGEQMSDSAVISYKLGQVAKIGHGGQTVQQVSKAIGCNNACMENGESLAAN